MDVSVADSWDVPDCVATRKTLDQHVMLALEEQLNLPREHSGELQAIDCIKVGTRKLADSTVELNALHYYFAVPPTVEWEDPENWQLKHTKRDHLVQTPDPSERLKIDGCDCGYEDGYTWVDVSRLAANHRRGGTKKDYVGEVTNWLTNDRDFEASCIPRISTAIQVMASQADPDFPEFANHNVGFLSQRN